MNYARSLLWVLFAVAVVAPLTGCGDEVSTKAPPITAKPKKEWKAMTKQEKIDLINRQPMPEEAKQKELAKINQGLN
jgi:hypothetical protein